jgi:hypothetical protein
MTQLVYAMSQPVPTTLYGQVITCRPSRRP